MLPLNQFHRHFEAAVDQGQAPTGPSAEDYRKLQNENLMAQVRLAKLQARVEFPKADGELIDLFNGSPEEIRTFAEKLQNKALEAGVPTPTPTPTPGTPAPTPTPTDPAPAPVPGPGEGAPPEAQETAQTRVLRTKLRSAALRKTIEPLEAEVAFQDFFKNTWNQHMIDRKTGHSSVSAGDAPVVIK